MLFSLFRLFTGVRVLRREHDRFLCRINAADGGKTARVLFWTSPGDLAELLEPLSFVSSPGDVPVRLDRWHGAEAVDDRLHGLSFGDYLRLENLYQGFISSQDIGSLHSMAEILYPGIKTEHIDEVFTFGLLQWVVQIKSLFRRMWSHFFRPATGAVSAPSMLEVMNNEIRALTGGDVTKEEVVFATDCWRALTELDFKAKDAEDIRRQLDKPKS